MGDVIYSSEGLFNTLVKYVCSNDFELTPSHNFENKFKMHLKDIGADWAVKFLFSKKGSKSIYDKTAGTILKILENLDLIKISGGLLKIITPKNRDAGGMLDGDDIFWDYVISALGRNGKIDNKTKLEIFNSGKGLFFRSLDYLKTDKECSHYLIWKSCKEYTIIQMKLPNRCHQIVALVARGYILFQLLILCRV